MLAPGFYNMDCMEGMKQFPDKYFELAIVDPPYGDGGGGSADRRDSAEGSTDTAGRFPRQNLRGGVRHKRHLTNGIRKGQRPPDWWNMGGEVRKKIISWDTAPGQSYFDELFRVSQNQIVWGGNYFELPATRCFLIWRKTNVPQKFSMAMAEYAWTSFNGNAKVFDFSAVGQSGRFHPTQKPPELYKWILANYAKPGDKILDTHVGSASSLVACHELGYEYTGFEIDADYYKLANERLEAVKAQTSIFDKLNIQDYL